MSLATNTKQLNIEQLKFLKSWCMRQLLLHSRNHTLAHRFMNKIMEIEAEYSQRTKEASNV